MDRKHVLVVDDNAAMLGVVRFNLERAGMVVTTVRNGRQALNALHDLLPDLMVVDYQMPEMDGRSLVEAIRGNPRTHHLPVIMVTAKEMELDTRILAGELGIQDVFQKPFSPRELTRVVSDRLADAATGA